MFMDETDDLIGILCNTKQDSKTGLQKSIIHIFSNPVIQVLLTSYGTNLYICYSIVTCK